MPRIRTLKPEHRQHRKIGPLSDRAYRLWVSMILEADDQGRFVCDAAHLRVVTWGYHPRTTIASVEAEIQTLAATGMVTLYGVAGTRYAVFPSWADHQRIEYPTPSKLPNPDGRVLEYPTEHAIQAELYEVLSRDRVFCGYSLSAIDRNVRIGSGYADLVLSAGETRIVVELKKTRADTGALRQVARYCTGIAGGAIGVLIASGLGPKSSARDFASSDVALITYDSSGNCTVAIPSKRIKECPGLVVKEVLVIERYVNAISQQGSRDITSTLGQSSRDIAATPGSEGIGSEGRERKGPNPSPRPKPAEEVAAAVKPQDDLIDKGADDWPSPEALVAMYNRLTPDNVPAVETISPKRRERARRLLRVFPARSWWEELFAEYGRSKFLSGKTQPGPGHESFRADFDWLMAVGKGGTENAVKVHDGAYR